MEFELTGLGIVPPEESMKIRSVNILRDVLTRQEITLRNAHDVAERKRKIAGPINREIVKHQKKIGNLEKQLAKATDPKEKESLGKDINLIKTKIKELQELIEVKSKNDKQIKRINAQNVTLNNHNHVSLAFMAEMGAHEFSSFAKDYIAQTDKTSEDISSSASTFVSPTLGLMPGFTNPFN